MCLNGATCDEMVQLIEHETCRFKVWHGEKDMGTYIVRSVNPDPKDWWAPEMMFDDPPRVWSPRPSDIEAKKFMALLGNSTGDTTTLWISKPCQLVRSDCFLTIMFKI